MWIEVCPDESQPVNPAGCSQALIWVEHAPGSALTAENLGDLMPAIALLLAVAFVFSVVRRRIWR